MQRAMAMRQGLHEGHLQTKAQQPVLVIHVRGRSCVPCKSHAHMDRSFVDVMCPMRIAARVPRGMPCRRLERPPGLGASWLKTYVRVQCNRCRGHGHGGDMYESGMRSREMHLGHAHHDVMCLVPCMW